MRTLLYRKNTSTGTVKVNGMDVPAYRENTYYWNSETRVVDIEIRENVTALKQGFSLSSLQEVDSYCLFTTPPYTKVIIYHDGNGNIREDYENNSTDCGYKTVFTKTKTYELRVPSGYVGQTVTGVGTYTSYISEVDANNNALLAAIADAENQLKYIRIDEYFEDVPESMIEDDSFTMSFDFRSKYWVGDHTYIPNLYTQGDDLISLNNNRLYKHNAKNIAIYYGNEPERSIVQLPIAIEPGVKKKFSSLGWITESKQGGFIELDKTFDRVLLYNSYQCSDYIELVNNLHHVRESWTFNQFVDLVNRANEPFMEEGEPLSSNIDKNKSFYTRRKFVDNYLVIRFILDNLLDSKGKQSTVTFYDLTANMSKHIR